MTDNNPKHVPAELSQSYLSPSMLKIKGSIKFVCPGMDSRSIDYSGRLESAYQEDFKPAVTVSLDQLIVPEASPRSPGIGNPVIPVRYAGSKFIQFAEKNKKLAFEAMGIMVGKTKSKVAMRVISPKGVEVMKFDLEPRCSWMNSSDDGWQKIEFIPDETGVYVVECLENNGNAYRIKSTIPGNAYFIDGEFRMVRPNGKVFFQVPRGIKNIKIEIGGEENEPLSASLLDPQNTVVASLSNVTASKLLSFTRTDSSVSEIWAIEFSNSQEDSFIRMGEGLDTVLSDRPEYLPLVP